MWVLDYNDILMLKIPSEEVFALTVNSKYKLRLKRYVSFVENDTFYFRKELTYLDYKKIISICSEIEPTVIVSEQLNSFIQYKELFIYERARLGNEIKSKDQKLFDKFENYKHTLFNVMTRKLREQQLWDSFFMAAMKKSANFSVTGSGKTSSVLGVYAYLKFKKKVNQLIVISPKNAFGSWKDEFNFCFSGIEDLRLFNIHDNKFKNKEEKILELIGNSSNYNLILINYEALPQYVETILNIITHKTLIVFDEVHRVKRIDGHWSNAVLKLSSKLSYTIALTGTPIPNSYLDIYNLLNLLYGDEYKEFFDFTPKMLKCPNEQEIKIINSKLQPFFCRTSKEQLDVPQANEDIFDVQYANDDENELLRILKLKYKNNKLALFIRILQLESNPKMLLSSIDLKDFAYLLDISLGGETLDYVDYSESVKKLIDSISITTKKKACIELVENLVKSGKKIILWCIFKDTIESFFILLESKGIKCRKIFGEVNLESRGEIIDDFKNNKIDVMITNPHTLAESVSLHNVCHDAVYFEYSYNLVHLLQSKDRIHRLGLPKGQYTQYYYSNLFYERGKREWSINREIYDRLKYKEQMMLDAIQQDYLEIMPTSDEDLEKIFETF